MKNTVLAALFIVGGLGLTSCAAKPATTSTRTPDCLAELRRIAADHRATITTKSGWTQPEKAVPIGKNHFLPLGPTRFSVQAGVSVDALGGSNGTTWTYYCDSDAPGQLFALDWRGTYQPVRLKP